MSLFSRLERSISDVVHRSDRRRMEALVARGATAVPVYDSDDACGYFNRELLVDPKLPCTGCAHSASGAPFPGHPSGERPCCFCVRNPQADPHVLHPRDGKDFTDFESTFAKRARKATADDGIWYDGTPAWKTPMDNYVATDRLQQQRVFDMLDRVERGEVKVEPRQPIPDANGTDVFCCDGGPAPGGHEWLCFGWLGFSIS